MAFKDRLKQAMTYRNTNGVELSHKSNISRSSICLYLKGDRLPKTEQVYRIAEALEVSPSYLLGIDDSMLTKHTKVVVNFDKEKAIREFYIDEITANLTWLDDETLKTINQMVKALRK